MEKIIEQKHIDMIDTEIDWSESVSEKLDISNMSKVFQSNVSLSNGICMTIVFDDYEYFELLGEKFDIREASQASAGTLYFQTDKAHAIGKVSNTTKTAMVVGDGFGILKSALSGLATLWGTDALPVHGSAISSAETGGISLIGGHRVGKTTGILNIIDNIGEGYVVSDDWLLARFLGEQLVVGTTDNSISLSTKSISENRHIEMLQKQQVKIDTDKRKTSYQPENLFGPDIKHCIGEVQINTVILLTTGLDRGISEITDHHNVGEFITEATYHFPYYNSSIKQSHIDQWNTGLLKTKTRILAYDYQHFQSMREGYNELLENIIKGKK